MKAFVHTARGAGSLLASVPLSYCALGMSVASMLWALMDLMAHTLQAG